jgi:hypothetical protein
MDSYNYGTPSTPDGKSGRNPAAKSSDRRGWQRVIGLGIVTTAATVMTVVTGSPEHVVSIIVPLLPYIPR